MIPSFNSGGVLPPYIGSTPAGTSANSSPYECSASEFVNHFNTSPERFKILSGFLQFRQDLLNNGIVSGFQWIDGSFTENVESKGRPPNDIDLVTFLHRPKKVWDELQWNHFVKQHQNGIFNQTLNKKTYKCDTFFVDMDIQPDSIVKQTAYWMGLFSHQRTTFQWKGMLSINLESDDNIAMEVLKRGCG